MLDDLRPRFDEVLASLETAAGWQTARVQRPVAILGRLDGVMTGIRQLRRTRPLETELVSGLRVPTLAEIARIKAWLLATRRTARDYLDSVVLMERLGEAGRGRPSSRSTTSIDRKAALRRSSTSSSGSPPRLLRTRPKSTSGARGLVGAASERRRARLAVG